MTAETQAAYAAAQLRSAEAALEEAKQRRDVAKKTAAEFADRAREASGSQEQPTPWDSVADPLTAGTPGDPDRGDRDVREQQARLIRDGMADTAPKPAGAKAGDGKGKPADSKTAKADPKPGTPGGTVSGTAKG